MALTTSDILNGIPDFNSKTEEEIKLFVSNADLIHTLAATDQRKTVLAVIRAKLVIADRLDDK